MIPLFVLMLLAVPLVASGQVVATTFEELQTVLRRGDMLDVTNSSGRRTTGRLGELSATSLEILARKTGSDGRDTSIPLARMSEMDVRQIRVRHRDSLWNGVLIGLSPGAAIGTTILFAGAGCDCYTIASRAPFALGTMLFAGGIGAGMGAAVDASMIKRTTVYVHPQSGMTGIVADRRDSIWNGPLIGLAVGAGSGLLIELAGRSEYEGFSGAGAIGLGAIGLATGLIVDVSNTGKSVTYGPLVSRSAAGLRLSVQF